MLPGASSAKCSILCNDLHRRQPQKIIRSQIPASAVGIGPNCTRYLRIVLKIIFLTIFISAWIIFLKIAVGVAAIHNEQPSKWPPKIIWSQILTSTVGMGPNCTNNLNILIKIIFLAIFLMAWRLLQWRQECWCRTGFGRKHYYQHVE